jgi:hypothetical protein
MSGAKPPVHHADLHEQVGKLGNALREAGAAGDRGAAFMLNVPRPHCDARGDSTAQCGLPCPDSRLNGVLDRRQIPQQRNTTDYGYGRQAFDCLADLYWFEKLAREARPCPAAAMELKLDGLRNAVAC